MTNQELRQVTRKIDSLIIGAKSVPELYRKLNTLQKNGDINWQALCSPRWVGGVLIAVAIRPSKDSDGESNLTGGTETRS